MKVEIHRNWETSLSVISELHVDGTFVCFGLEPSRKTPVHEGHPCIQAGTFRVVLTKSPHLGYLTPEVLNVPGREAIRWHIGNKPADVLGCVAVGRKRAVDWVGESSLAFHDDLMPILENARSDGELIEVTYIDPS
jgi:hypothetical protein